MPETNTQIAGEMAKVIVEKIWPEQMVKIAFANCDITELLNLKRILVKDILLTMLDGVRPQRDGQDKPVSDYPLTPFDTERASDVRDNAYGANEKYQLHTLLATQTVLLADIRFALMELLQYKRDDVHT